jgi:hypothetical protein
MKREKKLEILIFFLIMISVDGSSQNYDFGPGYRFSLFKNTKVEELANAVENEDVIFLTIFLLLLDK